MMASPQMIACHESDVVGMERNHGQHSGTGLVTEVHACSSTHALDSCILGIPLPETAASTGSSPGAIGGHQMATNRYMASEAVDFPHE